jgi:NAD(P)-dependent dehydrogenase (short-subunit alcohol dehydrogenase family)
VQAKPGIQGTLSLIQLDANDDASIEAAAKKIEQDFSKLDVLINNAGVCPETDGQWPANRQQMRTIFETNVFGPTLLTEALIPVMKRSSNPRIINVSSTLGSMSLISDHSSPYSQVKYPAYRMSKAALNMSTAYQYAQLKDGFKVWTYCPGYVVTDLGGDREERKAQGLESSETSAQGLLQIVQGERDADVGGFVGRRGEKYGW